MAKIVEEEVKPLRDDQMASIKKVSTFRRLLPQIIVTIIKNLINFNKSLFDGFSSIIIPSLQGIATGVNAHELIRISPTEASWLASLTFIGHPFGSLLSGFISDALGRRRALLLIVSPAVIAFVWLGLAQTFVLICLAFVFLSFIYGLKDAPATIYISEVSEPSVRGMMLAVSVIARNAGHFVVYLLGAFLTWREVSIACSSIPVIIVIAICFIPESPNWLLSKDRPKDAMKSLQWLRGWVPKELVQDEFKKLQTHSIVSSACDTCAEQLIPCPHPKATLRDKLMELTKKRTMKPFVLVILLEFLVEFGGAIVWRPYFVQVLKAYGMPMDLNVMMITLGLLSIFGSCFFMVAVKSFGKRLLYLTSTAVVVICSVGLSVFGFVFFPPNWTSFENPWDKSIPDFDLIRNKVGNYGYVALGLLFIVQFSTSVGLYAVPSLIHAEVFPFKLRSFLCGIALALRYTFAAIALKTYYNIEIWFTLSGACLFYATLSFIGLITMYFILPETENRSLEDIELHYADDTKGFTDINIRISNNNNRPHSTK